MIYDECRNIIAYNPKMKILLSTETWFCFMYRDKNNSKVIVEMKFYDDTELSSVKEIVEHYGSL